MTEIPWFEMSMVALCIVLLLRLVEYVITGG